MKKENILEVWIMVKRLSEGAVQTIRRKMPALDNLENSDFYNYIKSLVWKNATGKEINSGVAVYFDVFSFNNVIFVLGKNIN